MVALASNVSSPFANKSVQAPIVKNTAPSFNGVPQISEKEDSLQMDFISMAAQKESKEPVFTGDSVITLAKTQSNPNGESEVGNNPFLVQFTSRVSVPNS